MNLGKNDLDEAFKTAVFEINDNNTYEFYYDVGIPRNIEAIRETIMQMNKEKGKKIDKTTITLMNEE